MTQFEIIHWQLISMSLALSSGFLFGVACYWKAKALALELQDQDGWLSEANFWRHHFNKDAAMFADDPDSYQEDARQ